MEGPKLYRNRLIPKESVLLDRDRILYRSSELLITQWETLKPKVSFTNGYSCYYLRSGYKISRFYMGEQFLYWYCDIIDTVYHEQNDTYLFTDLLADVIILPDGKVRVLDLDELADAHRQGLLSTSLLHQALYRLNSLLTIIYSSRLEELTCPFMEILSQTQALSTRPDGGTAAV